MKVLTFSRTFPAYHPRAGQPTYFVEKILFGLPEFIDHSMSLFDGSTEFLEKLFELNPQIEKEAIRKFWRSLNGNWFLEFKDDDPIIPKGHTIRANRKDGKKWKVGDVFSPRVWSGKPYYSKQIIIAPPIEVKRVWDFSIDHDGCIFIDGCLYAYSSSTDLIDALAQNDGLSHPDLLSWFKYPKNFSGQIICWNPDVRY